MTTVLLLSLGMIAVGIMILDLYRRFENLSQELERMRRLTARTPHPYRDPAPFDPASLCPNPKCANDWGHVECQECLERLRSGDG